jgi:hypothetical protein
MRTWINPYYVNNWRSFWGMIEKPFLNTLYPLNDWTTTITENYSYYGLGTGTIWTNYSTNIIVTDNLVF